MYNVESNFPESVDDLIFYQDADIDKQEAIKQYNQLINSGDYEGAYQVRDTNNLHCLNAELVNMLINRTKKLQKQAITLTTRERNYFETDRPENPKYGTIWISQRNEV